MRTRVAEMAVITVVIVAIVAVITTRPHFGAESSWMAASVTPTTATMSQDVVGTPVVSPTTMSAAAQGLATTPMATATAMTSSSRGFELPRETVYNPEGLTTPMDAQVATAEEALDVALWLARANGAVSPQLKELKLERIEAALAEAQRLAGEDPSTAMQGQPGIDPVRPVWRIVFDGDTFTHPSCPASDVDERGTPETEGCGSSPRVQYIIDAATGQLVSATYGWLTDPEHDQDPSTP
jgi:hypothetical protein